MQLNRSTFYACFSSKQWVFMAAFANADGGTPNCFFVNSVMELAPHDAELAAYDQGHISRVAALVAGSLVRAGAALTLALESRLEAD